MHFPILPIEARGFAGVQIPGGYSWTITSAFGELLQVAEQRYGSRDRSWTPIGIEFHGDRPMVWYPRAHDGRRQISIILSNNARLNITSALYELAHEVIHVLSPTGGRDAPVIEEGLATKFALEVSALNPPAAVLPPGSPYAPALAAVEQLLAHEADAIRQLRRREPEFRSMTAEIILDTYPDFDAAVARRLCTPWNEGAAPGA